MMCGGGLGLQARFAAAAGTTQNTLDDGMPLWRSAAPLVVLLRTCAPSLKAFFCADFPVLSQLLSVALIESFPEGVVP
jgi:hypothetical protein